MRWRLLRDKLSAERAVYLYNRPGYGKSTPTTAGVDAVAAADRLARLLTASGVTEPVILVGHSAGALRAMCFAIRHRERLAGLVLVDPSVPSPSVRMVIRMVLRSAGRYAEAGRRSAVEFDAGGAYRRAVRAEAAVWRASGAQAASGPIPPDLPLAVITRAAPRAQRHRLERAMDKISWRDSWQAHERLTRGSSQALHLTAVHSGHCVHIDEPEIIIEATRQVASRRTAAPGT